MRKEKFKVVTNDEDNHCLEVGEIVYLVEDDGTDRKGYISDDGCAQWLYDYEVVIVKD